MYISSIALGTVYCVGGSGSVSDNWYSYLHPLLTHQILSHCPWYDEGISVPSAVVSPEPKIEEPLQDPFGESESLEAAPRHMYKHQHFKGYSQKGGCHCYYISVLILAFQGFTSMTYWKSSMEVIHAPEEASCS